MVPPAKRLPWIHIIREVDNVPLDFDFNKVYRLLLPGDDRPHGFIEPATVSRIPWTTHFEVNHSLRTVTLRAPDCESRRLSEYCDAAFQQVVNVIVDGPQLLFPYVIGHSEKCLVMGADFFLSIERFPSSLFGITSRGAHMTGYVRADPDAHPSKGIKIWVARRSNHLFTYPDMLDSTAAGGVKAEHTPRECMEAEAQEEASIGTNYLNNFLAAAGTVTYVHRDETKGTIDPSVIYVYDLEMTESFIPTPGDEEVSEFKLMSIDEIKHAMLSRRFKPNSALVMIDFFVRHGIITQELETEYVDIVNGLRRPLPVPTVARSDGQRNSI